MAEMKPSTQGDTTQGMCDLALRIELVPEFDSQGGHLPETGLRVGAAEEVGADEKLPDNKNPTTEEKTHGI